MKLHYRVLNHPEATQHVFVLHGLFAASDNLLRLGKELANSFNVYLIDLRNHGESPHSSIMDYPSMAQDLIDLMDDLSLASCAFVGHSMGGKVAMQVALNFPERVDRLIVADIAPVKYLPGHEQIIQGLEFLAKVPPSSRAQADQALADYVDDESVRQFLIKNLRKSPSSHGLAWRFNLDAITEHYSDILSAPSGIPFQKPTLFIAGEHSDYIKLEHREVVLRLFPKASMKVIQGTTHWLHAQKPSVFNAQCVRFLSV
jgi:esterase